MGMGSALKLKQILTNTEYILAIELLCAAQGVEFHRPLRAGIGSRRTLQLVRRYVPGLDQDRALAPDMERIRTLVAGGTLGRILPEMKRRPIH
jgi:histidine ammonia-lyase